MEDIEELFDEFKCCQAGTDFSFSVEKLGNG